MAEVNTGDGGGGGKHAKKRAKKASTKIDMTPMVDLAFLLLTFFVLTSTFSKPKTMEINFPAKPEDEKLNIKVNNAITFLITKEDFDKIADFLEIAGYKEILTQDAFALLYRIGSVISRHDCNIEVALITTEGQRAIDVFYLTQCGEKLTREVEAQLEPDLMKVLTDS